MLKNSVLFFNFRFYIPSQVLDWYGHKTMTPYQMALLNLFSNFDLHNKAQFSQQTRAELDSFTEVELADSYFTVAFLATAMAFLKEEHWLQDQQKELPKTFKAFVEPIFKSELLPISFLQNFFETSSLKESGVVRQKAALIESEILQLVKAKPYAGQKVFLIHALNKMSELFNYEIQLKEHKKSQDKHLGLTFYRTFDRLDEIFNLNYEADNGNAGMMEAAENTERVYAGSGVGVQSGYSTVLTALNQLNLKPGDRLVDLGSGYGRVGLVAGLVRDDIYFIGYEFVRHRVDIANQASQNMQLQDRVQFHTCDLSNRSFQIPDAEVYYLYDPFSEETYLYVLSQLVQISRRKKITIVTKGNARGQLLKVAQQEGWPAPREFDDSNLCLFETF